MIETLQISNYALIEKLEVEFDPGFNIITGETGAGKSIILGALGLIMGERADLRTVRDPGRKTVVEAVFSLGGRSDINAMLEEADVDTDPERCILRRELTAKGGSRAFINDTPVNLTVLRDVALRLTDIHSQHQNMLLGNPDYQLNLVDAMADNGGLLEEYTKAYRLYRKALEKYRSTRDMVTRSRNEAEYLGYQLEQLDALNIQAGEQHELERMRDLLANAGQIKEDTAAVLDNLQGSTDICAALQRASERLERMSDIFDSAPELSARLAAAKVEIQDIVETLADFDNSVKANPGELDNIEDRLGRLYSLEAKHHVDSDTELARLRDTLRSQLEAITNSDETLGRLEEEARKAKRQAVMVARTLSERRVAAAEKLAASIVAKATPMGMPNLRCAIELTPGKLTATGMDSVQMMVAFNKNQPPMPVGKTASGGESSRVMLAVKAIVAEKMQLGTLIFDEVDTGVSGDIANRMGLMMAQLARNAQVITITHLPQVAARGSRHLKVYKHDDETSTMTEVSLLDREARERELALMLSGDADSQTALETARALLDERQ
ncbi:MAG: DNA repair protein RecN [Muribaculaceae bacterium]|nr:DNA repair protein RecN [Muribaculaceae bacterium]